MPLPPAGINAIAIDDLGWQPSQANDSIREWRIESGALSLNYFPIPPDLTARPGDDDTLWATWANQGREQALVEARWVKLGDLPATQTVLKARLPAGMSYVGAVIVPFAECSWVIKLHLPETGPTGIREALAFDAFLATGRPIHEWSPGAGQPAGPSPLPVSVLPSDGVEWDAVVPDHPLSQVRSWLDRLGDTTTFTAEIAGLTPL